MYNTSHHLDNDTHQGAFYPSQQFTNHTDGVSSLDNCRLDCNDLFIGGSIQTLLGILLGMVQAKMFSSKEEVTHLHLITFWKDSFLRHNESYAQLVKIFNYRFKNNWGVLKYGLWPIGMILGTAQSPIVTGSYVNKWKYLLGHHQVSTGGGGGDEDKMIMSERWYFRRVFWHRWLQITSLGFPSTLFYTLKGSGDIKAGLIIYCFITCLLLLVYKTMNEKVFLNYVDHGTYDDLPPQHHHHISNESLVHSSPLAHYDHQSSIYFNNYEQLYALWITTTAFMCSFQAIPILSAFYRVLISSGLVILGCLLIKLLQHLVAWLSRRGHLV